MAGAETPPSTIHGHGYTGPITVNGGFAILGDVILSDSERQRRTECLQAFKTSTYESYKNAPNPKPEPGTCQWILQHPKFRGWDESNQRRILWLSADPGCGKSVFSRYYVDMLQAAGDVTVCYFFFKDNDEQNDLNIALCAVLHQLFSDQPQLISDAIPSWERNKTLIQRETGTMWRTLREAMLTSRKKIVCVLDALDECSHADREQLIEMLCDFHQADVVTPVNPLKFLVTSRPYDDVQQGFDRLQSSSSEIRLRGEHENKEINREINMIIKRKVRALANEYKLSADNRNVLLSHLIHMEHRTYLWLRLAMSAVRNQYRYSLSPNKVNIAGLRLPPNVGAAYGQVLSKIDAALKGKVMNILLVVVGARRPLTSQALFTALNVLSYDCPDEFSLEEFDKIRFEEQIRDWCGLFVYVDCSRVYLMHQTAKEYLLVRAHQSPLQPWQGCLAQLDVERSMARMCLKYLCIPNIEPHDGGDTAAWAVRRARYTGEYDDNASPHDFYHYCAENWASHLQECDTASLDRDLHKYISIVGQPSKTEIWSGIMWDYEKPRNVLMQHVLAAHGHTVALKCLHSIGNINWNACDSSGKTALHWAASGGDVTTVRLLIVMGADIDNRESDDHGRTALHLAAERHHLRTVECLLDSGAGIDVENYQGQTPLESIVDHGYTLGVLRALMGRNSSRKSDALCQAATGGEPEAVKLLIELGADVNATNRYSQTALSAAARSYQLEVAAILLAAGADIDIPDGDGRSILQVACEGCSYELVQMLLDHRYKALASEAIPEESTQSIAQHFPADHRGFYSGALATAIDWEDLDMVDLLFSRAPLAIEGENFDAALLVAATQTSLAPMQVLLSRATKQIDTALYRKLLCEAVHREVVWDSQGGMLEFLLKYRAQWPFDIDFREMVIESIRSSDGYNYHTGGGIGKMACRLIERGKDIMSNVTYFQVLEELVAHTDEWRTSAKRPDENWIMLKTVLEQISTNVHGATVGSPAVMKAPAYWERFEALKTFLDRQSHVHQIEDSCRDIMHKALHIWHTGTPPL